MTSEELKQQAAEAAAARVEPGMKLGIGTGSTADAFTRALGARVRSGLDIIGVPTSERTKRLAGIEGIRLTTLEDAPELDLTVDGADEFDRNLRLVKGGGGALLREKIVAAASRAMIVIADGSKLVAMIGAFPLPIEVMPFGLGATRRKVERLVSGLGLVGSLSLRQDAGGLPYLTDGGHYILDASFGRIPDPEALAAGLDATTGVVEHGLFIGLATEAFVARPEGVEILRRGTA